VINEGRIVVLYSHVLHPIDRVIDVSALFHLISLHSHLLTPALFLQLVADISSKSILPVCDLLVDVGVSVVTDHTHVQIVLIVLVP